MGHIPNYTQCSPMEIALNAEDDRLPFLDTLAHVSPFPCKLDRGLNSLCTGIHWQHHVIPESGGNLLGKFTKHRVMKGARGKGEALGLCHKRGDNARVTMALINGTTREIMNLCPSGKEKTYEYAESISMYSLPSGSHTLR